MISSIICYNRNKERIFERKSYNFSFQLLTSVNCKKFRKKRIVNVCKLFGKSISLIHNIRKPEKKHFSTSLKRKEKQYRRTALRSLNRIVKMEKVQVSDSELVTLYIRGNEKAFEKLVQRHKSRIYTTIYLIVKDQYVAEDLLQDTFIKAVDTIKGGRYNDEGKFLPWIIRIAHNLAIDYFRRDKRYPNVVFEDGSSVFNTLDFTEDSMESVQIRQETHEQLREMIQRLPDVQKQVLIMRHYEDMSFQEIADATGVSINTALGRMRYALINLRKQFNQRAPQYDKNFYLR